jgi:uncharacterized protein (TIGR00106 family)
MRDSVIADIKILPFNTGTAGVGNFIAAAVSLLKETPGIRYQVTPMSTIMEGPLDRILELAGEMHEVPFTMGASRVVTTISIDDRRDKHITMEYKVSAVEEKLGKTSEPALSAAG